MMARPLYEKKAEVKMAPKTPAKGVRRPRASRGPLLVLLAVPALVLLLIGGGLAYRHLHQQEVETAAAEEAPVPAKAPASASHASSNVSQPMAPIPVSAPTPAQAPGSAAASNGAQALPQLAEFRASVLTEQDASERMKRILVIFESGSSVEKAGAYRALVEMRNFAIALLPGVIPASSERALPWIADACAQLKAAGAIRPLVTRALEQPGKTPYNLVKAIGKLATPDSREFCLNAMKQDQYPRLRAWAWEAFVPCAKRDDVALLTAALEKGEGYQQEYAADALGRLAQNPDVSANLAKQLEARLSMLQDKGHRVAIARALSKLPIADTQGLLGALLHDADPNVRIQAVKGLGNDSFTLGQLPSALQGENDPVVQCEIVKILTEHPQSAAVPQLLKLLDSSAYEVSKSAQKALVAAYGVDYGYRAAPWESWIAMGEKEGDRNRTKLFQSRERKRQADRLAALQSSELISGN